MEGNLVNKAFYHDDNDYAEMQSAREACIRARIEEAINKEIGYDPNKYAEVLVDLAMRESIERF